MKFIAVIIMLSSILLCACKEQNSAIEEPVKNDKQKPKQKHENKPQTTPRKNKKKLLSEHHLTWEELLAKYYQNECQIKEKLRPIYTHKVKLDILRAYLPQLYAEQYYHWFITKESGRLEQTDPYFPIGPVEIYKVSEERENDAVVLASVLCEQKRSQQKLYRYFKITLKREDNRWLIDREERMNIREKFTFITLSDHNPFGYLSIHKFTNTSAPSIRQGSPQELIQSLVALGEYAQSKHNKLVVQILPELTATVRPYVSKRYFDELTAKNEPDVRPISARINELKTTERPPAMPNTPGHVHWEISFDTYYSKDKKKFRPYLYYLALVEEDGRWKVAGEVSKIFRNYPNPEPMFRNFLYWQMH